MPAKPSYSHRIPEILQGLERCSSEWIDRRSLEEMAGVSKTVAWRLLRQLGAVEGPGNTLVVTRAQAIEGLKRMLAEGGSAGREMRRRSRLEQYLEGMRGYVAAQRTTVASHSQALDLVNTRFGKLPGNVVLTPRSLHVDFEDAEGFLRSVGAVVFALNNDYEAIREFIETQQSK
jgi:hypothetical protein